MIVPPKDYNSTVNDLKYSNQWHEAIKVELQKLFSLGTFEYVDSLLQKKTINTKWVFTIKYTLTELVDCFKA